MAAMFFGSNVKMHQTVGESVAYVDALATFAAQSDLQLFLILPFTSLDAVIDRAHASGIWIGAQNMHWAPDGEFTGEISASMLRAMGVDVVLLGHAERRHVFNEDDALIRRKVEAALANELRVLLCVGETADERSHGAGEHTVARQLKMSLHGVTDLTNVMIAYEPVWAIGAAGSAADPAVIAESAAAIRTLYDEPPLFYGGSVTATSARSYAGIAGIDGLFVGRAARSVPGFIDVAQAAYPALQRAQTAAARTPHERE